MNSDGNLFFCWGLGVLKGGLMIEGGEANADPFTPNRDPGGNFVFPSV